MKKYKAIGFVAARLFGGKSDAILDSLIAFNVRGVESPLPESAQAEFAEGVTAYNKMNEQVKNILPNCFDSAGYWGSLYDQIFDDPSAAWDFYSILERAPIGGREDFFRGFGIRQADMILVGNLIWDRQAWLDLMNESKKG